MASKVLVPAPPFAKLQVKKSPPEPSSGFIINGNDAVARVAHLEHSVRFLQEQHRLMLSGLHTEIEALRERNRDLQFQLIFNKESSQKPSSPSAEEAVESNEEANLRREVSRLERESAAAKSEAKAAKARALQLQKLVDAQTEKLREVEVSSQGEGAEAGGEAAGRGELRARLQEAERLVRRLRGDAERQRRECMKNSLHASLRASGLDGGFGFQNTYHFPPPIHTPDFWREPVREEFGARSSRRPLTLPELAAQRGQRAALYANNHTRPRGYDHKKKTSPSNGEAASVKTADEHSECRLEPIIPNDFKRTMDKTIDMNSKQTYPELKIVVTKIIQLDKVTAAGEAGRPRARRPPHRKPAPDHT